MNKVNETMRITTTVTESRRVDKEVNLPYFCKYGDQYIKVISENTAIGVEPSDGWCRILQAGYYCFKEKVAKGTEITEVEFNEALELALTRLNDQISSVASLMFYKEMAQPERDPDEYHDTITLERLSEQNTEGRV